jgi:hypothetical protein
MRAALLRTVKVLPAPLSRRGRRLLTSVDILQRVTPPASAPLTRGRRRARKLSPECPEMPPDARHDEKRQSAPLSFLITALSFLIIRAREKMRNDLK